MKRIFSLILAAFYSLFAGIGFNLPKDDNFYYNAKDPTFYSPTIGDVDYQSIYSSLYGASWSRAESCDTTLYLDDPIERSTFGDLAGGDIGLASCYRPLAKDTYEVVVSDKSITFTVTEEGARITAPLLGTINTSHFSCDYGATMEFLFSYNGVSYVMRITDAKCWYCCASKQEPSDGRYTAVTGDSLKGKEVAAGYVLCVGHAPSDKHSATKVTITKLS